jgi:putative restriction endonuclease
MTRRIKELYDYRCQFCGLKLVLPGGVTYAEGAHIRPLGAPHHGDDTEANVLCLCPNDHLLFDRGAVFLTDEVELVNAVTGTSRGTVQTVSGHRLDAASIRYHRDLFQ